MNQHSNAGASVPIIAMLRAAFARWHVEKWFERAKQEAGFGAFEVRTYKSLLRHWLCSRIVMYFIADQTQLLRGEKPEDHAGAGRGCGQYALVDDFEDVPAFVETADSAMRMCSKRRHGVCGTRAGRMPRSSPGRSAIAASKPRWAPPSRRRNRRCLRNAVSFIMANH